MYRIVILDADDKTLIMNSGKVCNILYTTEDLLFEDLPSINNCEGNIVAKRLVQEIPKIKNDKIYSTMLNRYGSRIRSICKLIEMCVEFPDGLVRFYNVN